MVRNKLHWQQRTQMHEHKEVHDVCTGAARSSILGMVNHLPAIGGGAA